MIAAWRILVVEDDAAISTSLVDGLGDAGFDPDRGGNRPRGAGGAATST
jgi:DNA-binding response OmpR family regulator